MRHTLTDSVTSYWDEHLHDLAVARHPIGTKQFFEDLTEYHFDKQRHLSRIIDYASYDGKELLDVGCGVGVDGVRFAEHGAHVTGVDISTRAIELARNNFDYAGLDADLRVMEGENLEFADHTFDAVYAHGILPYAKDFHRVAMEVHRVLKPGGEAIFQTYNRRSWLYLLWKSMKVSLEHEQARAFTSTQEKRSTSWCDSSKRRTSLPSVSRSGPGCRRAPRERSTPVFPILGVFRLNGQSKRDDGMIVRSCKGQSISGLSNKGCDSCREPCFLSVFIVFGPLPVW